MPRIDKTCVCGTQFSVNLYRKDTAKFCSATCQRRYRHFPKTGPSIANSISKLGERNSMWGKIKENPGYSAIHDYVRHRKLPSFTCDHCGEEKKLDLANKSGQYKRDVDDWLWLCRACHLRYDGHIKNLELGRRGRNYVKKV